MHTYTNGLLIVKTVSDSTIIQLSNYNLPLNISTYLFVSFRKNLSPDLRVWMDLANQIC